MRDYIAEANKFMYDDNYVVESSVLEIQRRKAQEHLTKVNDRLISKGHSMNELELEKLKKRRASLYKKIADLYDKMQKQSN